MSWRVGRWEMFCSPRFFRGVVCSLSFGIGVCAGASVAYADCVPKVKAKNSVKVTEEDKALALGRFKAGNDLLKRNDYAGALSLFLQSRELWQNRSNTKNAAICLYELGLFPEALALYEELQDRFAADLDPDEQALVAATVAELQKRVLVVDIQESKGTFSIDDEPCGALPRKPPVYLMPGSHILRVLRPGEPEVLGEFSGEGGTRTTVSIPRPRAPVVLPPPPQNEKWFAGVRGGPVLGFSSVRFDNQINLEVMTGGIVHAQGGFRLPSGLTVMLASGVIYAERDNDPLHHSFQFGKEEKFQATYDIRPQVHLFAPFMGFMVGYEPIVRKRWDFWVRTGAGILGVQAKRVLDVKVTGPTSSTTDVITEGQGSILYSVPAYGALDFGFSLRVGLLRLGIGLESFVIFHTGSSFAAGRIQPRGPSDASGRPLNECSATWQEGTNIRCVPGITFPTQPSYRASVLIMPQIVVGVAQ